MAAHGRSSPSFLALALVLTHPVLLSCGKDREDAAVRPPPPAATEKKPRSNVKKFESPVPYGKQVACSDLVDAAKFAPFLNAEVGEIKDRSTSNREATSVCAFMRGGTPPTSNQQLKAYQKNAMRLGVLPGDELCTVTAFCSYPAELEDLRKKCEAAGGSESEALGQLACVRRTQRASEYAYTYRTIDADTGCLYEVMGGPSVTDETLVQLCTKAALDTIGPENLRAFR